MLTRSSPAQRRPGREPRRHFVAALDRELEFARSTKAGARTPATRPASGRRGAPAAALNEGRGANPGDTFSSRPPAQAAVRAQRRPGREPRRHLEELDGTHRSDPRSTKAGARTPATRGRAPSRPGARRRSTKAGARTPATLDGLKHLPPPLRPLNEGRGANPGDTSGCGDAPTGRRTSLNEGRGANPGDTRTGSDVGARRRARSTKAGARTPATHGRRK